MKMLHSRTFSLSFFHWCCFHSFSIKRRSLLSFFFFFHVLALWKISWLRELNEAVEREDSKSKPTDRALIFLLSFIIYFVFLWCVVIFPPSLIYFGSTWAQCLLPGPRIYEFHFHTYSYDPDTCRLCEKYTETVWRRNRPLI